MKASITKNILRGAGAAVLWLFVWQVIYMATANELLIVSPVAVAKRIFMLAQTHDFRLSVLMSVLRIVEGLLIGTAAGIAVGCICVPANAVITPLMTVIKATPVASFIMLAWIWLKRDSIPVFISVLMVLPIIGNAVRTGIIGVPKELLEFSKMYRLKRIQKLRYIYIPSVMPHFASALCTSAGLVWKAGVAAEVLCQPKNSIGGNLFNAKNMLDTLDVFAWTAVVVIISLCLELIIRALLKKISSAVPYDKDK